MSQHIEWASGGLLDYTVNPGEWVDGYGSRNAGVALWAGDEDGTIIEFGSKEFAIEHLRAWADLLETARDTSVYGTCRWCGAQIVYVPESMGDDPSVWVHVGELGAETPTTCDVANRDRPRGIRRGPVLDIGPEHRFVDDEPTCRDCGTAREDEEDTVCRPEPADPDDDETGDNNQEPA